jgi:hypothetical protein
VTRLCGREAYNIPAEHRGPLEWENKRRNVASPPSNPTDATTTSPMPGTLPSNLGSALECGGNAQQRAATMAAKKAKRQLTKAANKAMRKHGARRRKVASPGAGDSIVEAARRLWLSAESLATSRVTSLRGYVRRLGTRISR